MWSSAFWKAAAERMVRGAAIAVAAAYFGADGVFDALNVNTWTDVAGLAVSGAVGSLILSLAGQATTGNGPALVSPEKVEEHS